MPLIKYGSAMPHWCELRHYTIDQLDAGQTLELERLGDKEILIVAEGACELDAGDIRVPARASTRLALDTPAGKFRVSDSLNGCTIVRLAGNWGQQIGGTGIMVVGKDDNRKGGGDSVSYPKTTKFDNHFHDFDEFWIFFSGRGTAWSEGKSYKVGPGDCIATAAGNHHDVSDIKSKQLKGVWFETTITPEARRGHLWLHKHGPKS